MDLRISLLKSIERGKKKVLASIEYVTLYQLKSADVLYMSYGVIFSTLKSLFLLFKHHHHTSLLSKILCILQFYLKIDDISI